ncbi:DUF1540 domain-containing protein [Selenihalanaerobacter shriftii]|uniref:DUF1540 domain-containing protein n=1 Tax=Selenihalanaerobacter shriftii TaxID=142842 RepID=A0A1T4K946_9FIRM|nr:DUF1540 domain-containing protein [Selenihalanaerobacter shriftii]SJZ38867.1 protein of unknown function [Selenihalanaerobacter shriftii]
MSKIGCNVSNCSYWGQGNVCQADKISVSNDSHSGKADMEAGSLGGKVTSNHSRETQCVTFKPANG